MSAPGPSHPFNLDKDRLLALLAGIGDASPDAMFAKDLEGRYLWMNAASAANVGLELSEIVGRLDRDFIDPATYDLLHQVDQEVTEARAPVVREQVFEMDGGPRSFLFSKRPLWSNGEVIGLVGTAHETTSQHRAERALRRQNELYETVLEVEAAISGEQGDYQTLLDTVLGEIRRITGADGASLEVPDGEEMVYEAANGVATPFLGFRLKTATSLSGRTLIEGTSTRCDDSDTDPRVDRDACRKIGIRSMLIIPLRYGDRGLGVLKAMSAQPNAFSDAKQQALELLKGFLGAAIGHKRTEHILIESDERLRLAQQIGKIGTFEWNVRANQVRVSPEFEELCGISKGSFEGGLEEWLALVHPQDVRMVEARLSEGFETGVFEAEWRLLAPDRTVRWFGSRGHVFKDRNGTPEQLLGVAIDMTRSKRLEEELSFLVHERTRELRATNVTLIETRDAALAASVAKSQFLANMSHEIRTPLNGVIGMTSLLLEKELNKETRHGLETIESSGRTLMRVIDDVLDLSKIEAGKLDIEPSDIELRHIVRDVVNLYQGHAKARGISLSSVLATGDCEAVVADAFRLRQILGNLVSNAVKFTAEGEVVLTCRCQVTGAGVRATFEVSDTGAGIPPERLEAVFESFTQADGSVQRKYGGTGLGLTISKRLTEMMGGEISVVSEIGKGSTFKVILPLSPSTARPPASASDDDSDAPIALNILLAEDNEVNIKVLEALLERVGCTVDIVHDGLEAISRNATGQYDLILMDVQMPTCDGIEATKAIRAEEARSGLPRRPIYALTASAMAQDRDECTEAGMDGLLPKPIPLPHLRTFLRNFADSRRRDES